MQEVVGNGRQPVEMRQSVLKKLDSTLFDVCQGFDEPALGHGALVLGKVAEEPLERFAPVEKRRPGRIETREELAHALRA